MSVNPYESPSIPSTVSASSAAAQSTVEDAVTIPESRAMRQAPAVSTADTITLRYVAAGFDNGLAMFTTYVLAKSISNEYPALQIATFLSAYFVYFLVLEALCGRTIGKFVVGLVVIRYDGRPITWWGAFVRTLLRPLEVNPILFGGLPAGIAALLSPYRQRIGDRLAGTVVVRAWRWQRYRKQLRD